MQAVFSYLLQMALPALAGALIWGFSKPWRQHRLTIKGQWAGPYRAGALLLFYMFLAGLLALTLTPSGFWRSLFQGKPPHFPPPFQGGVNLIPFRESIQLFTFYVQHGLWDAILINFPGNIVMFMPIGFFSGLLSDRPRWWKSTFLSFGLSAFIEIFQLYVSRGTDIDDVILNTLGGFLGYGAFLLLRRIAPTLVQKCAKIRKGSV